MLKAKCQYKYTVQCHVCENVTLTYEKGNGTTTTFNGLLSKHQDQC